MCIYIYSPFNSEVMTSSILKSCSSPVSFEETVCFFFFSALQAVNQHVKSAMVQWIGGVVKDKFEKLVNETGDETGEDTEETFFV